MYNLLKKEEIIFEASVQTEPLFHVHLAGYTEPDPNYIIYHSALSPEDLALFQFEYVTNGVGYIESSGYKYRVKKGDLFFINKGCERLYYTDKDFLLEKKWITVSGTLIDALLKEYNVINDVIVCHNYDDAYLQKELDFLRRNSELSQSEINLHSAILIHRIIQTLSQKNYHHNDSIQLDIAHEIRSYIKQCIHKRFTLDDISKQLFLSKNQIINMFKKKFHITPMQYSIKLKIENAKFMLENSDVSINKISDALAFTDNRHFAKTFKSVMGMSPSEYRKTKRLEQQNSTPPRFDTK